MDLLPICEMPSTRRPEWGGNLEGTPPPLSRRGEVISIRTCKGGTRRREGRELLSECKVNKIMNYEDGKRK